MPSRYAQWMYDWENRLTSVDNNRVVRPLEWGAEWARDWPCRNGFRSGTPENPEKFFLDYNRHILVTSDEFYAYAKPTDFRLERRQVQVFSTREVPDPKLEAKVRGTYGEFLRFTSPVRSPYPENNLANARWFPVQGRRNRSSRHSALAALAPPRALTEYTSRTRTGGPCATYGSRSIASPRR